MQLSKKAFWDTHVETLDKVRHADFIIVKVLEYGTWEDLLAIARFYGVDALKKKATQAKFYPDTASFLSAIFNLRKEEVSCFNPKQFQKTA